MIAFLKGQLFLKSTDSIVLLAGGVGYDVHVSGTTMAELPEEGTELSFYIHTHVAEGVFALYGFQKMAEKSLFRKLMSVSGIGPKLAMQILSGYSPGIIVEAILTGDIAKLTSISGVGKKTAERMVMELKEKLTDLSSESIKMSSPSKGQVTDEALSVLINLGYQRLQAERALASVPAESRNNLESVIKKALGHLSKS